MSKKIKNMKLQPNNIRRCLIKDSIEIRNLLEQRFNELELSGKDIIEDAKKNRYKLSPSALSRYRTTGNVKGTLSQENIIWLCYRYAVDLKVVLVEIIPYDEAECLKRLKKQF